MIGQGVDDVEAKMITLSKGFSQRMKSTDFREPYLVGFDERPRKVGRRAAAAG